MPLVSVIVVNWNKRELLERCLESLHKQTFQDYELLVVDNGSRDGSAKMVSERFAKARVIKLKENTGFSKGNNVGIRESSGKLIAFLNNDAEADPKWLEELHKPLLSESRIGFCASKMLFYKDRSLINSAGQLYLSIGKARDRGLMERDLGQYEEPSYVFGACAGAALYRRSVVEEIGYFDEEFSPACYEDVDLSFRAQLAGYRCLYVPQAVVYHHSKSTLGASKRFHVYLCERNSIYALIKNMPTGLLRKHSLKIIICWVLLFFVKTLKGYGFSCLSAWWAAFKKRCDLMEKRRHIQSAARVSDAYVESLITRENIFSWIAGSYRRAAVERRYQRLS